MNLKALFEHCLFPCTTQEQGDPRTSSHVHTKVSSLKTFATHMLMKDCMMSGVALWSTAILSASVLMYRGVNHAQIRLPCMSFAPNFG